MLGVRSLWLKLVDVSVDGCCLDCLFWTLNAAHSFEGLLALGVKRPKYAVFVFQMTLCVPSKCGQWLRIGKTACQEQVKLLMITSIKRKRTYSKELFCSLTLSRPCHFRSLQYHSAWACLSEGPRHPILFKSTVEFANEAVFVLRIIAIEGLMDL